MVHESSTSYSSYFSEPQEKMRELVLKQSSACRLLGMNAWTENTAPEVPYAAAVGDGVVPAVQGRADLPCRQPSSPMSGHILRVFKR